MALQMIIMMCVRECVSYAMPLQMMLSLDWRWRWTRWGGWGGGEEEEEERAHRRVKRRNHRQAERTPSHEPRVANRESGDGKFQHIIARARTHRQQDPPPSQDDGKLEHFIGGEALQDQPHPRALRACSCHHAHIFVLDLAAVTSR